MKIAILVEEHYRILETWYPYIRLQEEGFAVVFVGTGQYLYKSKEQYPLKEQISILAISPDEFDGVIIPGGLSSEILQRYPKVNAFVKEMFEQNKLVAAIGEGMEVLASAGILPNKPGAADSGFNDEVNITNDADIDQAVVVEGNLITAQNTAHLPKFCKEIIKSLNYKAIGVNGDFIAVSSIKSRSLWVNQ